MTKRNTDPKEPDIREIRKEQAEKALAIANKIDDTAFIGELNDDKYYIVIRRPHFANDVASELLYAGIETKQEHRSMANDDVLYLLDEKKTEETPDE